MQRGSATLAIGHLQSPSYRMALYVVFEQVCKLDLESCIVDKV